MSKTNPYEAVIASFLLGSPYKTDYCQVLITKDDETRLFGVNDQFLGKRMPDGTIHLLNITRGHCIEGRAILRLAWQSFPDAVMMMS